MALAIISTVGMVIFAYFCWKYFQRQNENVRGEVDDVVKAVEREPLRIPPQIKQKLSSFQDVQSAQQFREMSVERLQDMLAVSSVALKVFEDQFERIADGYERIEKHLEEARQQMQQSGGIILNALVKQPSGRGMYEAEGKRLDAQADRALTAMEEELTSVESVLSVIPAKYRMSAILEQMYSYLDDGECDSWESCVKTFKEDVHRMQQNANFAAVISRLDLIEQHAAATARNTKVMAFFSGISAWNTGVIASRLR